MTMRDLEGQAFSYSTAQPAKKVTPSLNRCDVWYPVLSCYCCWCIGIFTIVSYAGARKATGTLISKTRCIKTEIYSYEFSEGGDRYVFNKKSTYMKRSAIASVIIGVMIFIGWMIFIGKNIGRIQN